MAADKLTKITLENIGKIRPKSERENITKLEQPGSLKIEKEQVEIKNPITLESIPTVITPPVSQNQSYQAKRTAEIDNILSEGLHEVFLKMGPIRQQEFKLAGEQTVVKIVNMLDKGKVKVKKIIDLIKNWLQLIPGVNKFFVEQEAKLKADKIMSIKNKDYV